MAKKESDCLNFDCLLVVVGAAGVVPDGGQEVTRGGRRCRGADELSDLRGRRTDAF